MKTRGRSIAPRPGLDGRRNQASEFRVAGLPSLPSGLREILAVGGLAAVAMLLRRL